MYSGLESLTHIAYTSSPGTVSYAASSVPECSPYTTLLAPQISGREYISKMVAGPSYGLHSNKYIPLHIPQSEYHFLPDTFLKPGPQGRFIGKAAEVREFVEEAFEKIFEVAFPSDISITICNEREFRNLAPHPSTIGLSFNRRKYGLLSEIFIRNDSLARVMLTIGHELGHVLTETLDNQHDEEAKAYAFSLTWMKVIQQEDIAGLGNVIITERPAENGLHNVAFRFVEKMMRKGKDAGEIYIHFIERMLSVNSRESMATEP